MSKKNNKKNSVIAADEVVAEEVIAAEVEVEETEVMAEEVLPEVHAGEEPEPEASAEVELTAPAETEHKIFVKSDSGVTEVHVKAATRQDAKYKVYLKIDQFGPNAKVPKFDVEKYLDRLSKKKEEGDEGKKKGKAKAKVTVVVDLDDVGKEPEVSVTTEPEVTEEV